MKWLIRQISNETEQVGPITLVTQPPLLRADNNCPKCGDDLHDIRNLFNCRQNKTRLTVKSLWTKPIEAATLLMIKT